MVQHIVACNFQLRTFTGIQFNTHSGFGYSKLCEPKAGEYNQHPRNLLNGYVHEGNDLLHYFIVPMSASRIETWIQPGYKLVGVEGVDGIKIERLARILNLNKSGFYHYFGSMQSYIEALVQYHISLAKPIASEIAGLRNIDPDLLKLIVKHKSFFLVESQLLVKSRPAQGYRNIDKAGEIINKELLTLWRNEYGLPGDMSVAQGYLNIIRHFIYARIDAKNISYEFLHKLSVETREVLGKAVREKNYGP